MLILTMDSGSLSQRWHNLTGAKSKNSKTNTADGQIFLGLSLAKFCASF